MCRFSDAWDGEAVWTQALPASEKRQGTKSPGQRGYGYGDLAVRFGLGVWDCRVIRDRVTPQPVVGRSSIVRWRGRRSRLTVLLRNGLGSRRQWERRRARTG